MSGIRAAFKHSCKSSVQKHTINTACSQLPASSFIDLHDNCEGASCHLCKCGSCLLIVGALSVLVYSEEAAAGVGGTFIWNPLLASDFFAYLVDHHCTRPKM